MADVIASKVDTANQFIRNIRDVGLPLFQSVVLLGVILWFGWWQLQESKSDKQAYREQADRMSAVVEANTKSNLEVSMALKSLEKEIQRK